MKNTATQTANTLKNTKLKNAKLKNATLLSKEQLETIFGGDPPLSRGTVTDTQD